MAEKLTPQQKMAVTNRGGKLLVSAAAGSGKTKVLVDRLMSYILDPVSPANLDEFLIITYTKAAASELRGKIAAKLTEHMAQQPENRHLQHQMQRLYLAKICTVHSFCGDILREYAYQLDLPADFRVADENECRQLRDSAMARMLEKAYENAQNDPDFRAFVDAQGLGRDDRLVPQILLQVYDSARCHLDADGWLEACIRAAEVEALEDAGQSIWGQYLMKELFSYLDLQIEAMVRCVEEAQRAEGMEKPAMLLRDTLWQLQFLRSAQTWDEVIERKKLEYGRLVISKKCPDQELAERIKAVRNGCKTGVTKRLKAFTDPSAQVLADMKQTTGAVRGMVQLVRRFSREYDRTKRSRRILDFGDLEHRMLQLLLGKGHSGPTVAADEIGRRFREIMVDEYQDSNAVQDAIFTTLTRKRNNCFMVGDVKQSIYQFRLADPGIFLEKYHSYADASQAQEGEGRRVMLSANFRSGGAVLKSVNDIFELCMCPKVGGLHYGEAEALREGIPHIALGEPEVELWTIQVQENTYPEEAAFVAKRVQELLDGSHYVRKGDMLRPIVAEDIAILLRSPGSVGGYYIDELAKLGIRCSSGGEDLLKTQEVTTLRGLLQTISNPRQDIPLLATLASPVCGFTADELALLRKEHRYGSIYDALVESKMPKAMQFVKTLDDLRRHARMHTLAQLIERIFVLLQMDHIFEAMSGGETRVANLRAFYGLAAQFESHSRHDLEQFLEHLDAVEEKGLAQSAQQVSAGVTLMSIHKSKGLEFPVVFVCGLSKSFNLEDAHEQVLCSQSLGLGLPAVDEYSRLRYPTIAKRAISAKIISDTVSEELRVLYVALTRARDRLIMTYASDTLQKDLMDIVGRMDMVQPQLLAQDVVCPGEWVLMTALRRTEAGELFRLGGRPMRTELGDPVWHIGVVEGVSNGEQNLISETETAAFPQEMLQRLERSLAFQYGHNAATMAPSKQTATQRKGRDKDAEAAENTRQVSFGRTWRKPSFVEQSADPADRGNAMHLLMQYLEYDCCESVAAVRDQVDTLVEKGYLTKAQGAMVDPEQIVTLFASDLGKKLRQAEHIVREFKFSILDGAHLYDPALEGEKILLQGVVDCAILEDDGITIIDFKTDYVTEQTLQDKVAHYRPQVMAYADAMMRIYGKPVKAALLYFFRLGEFAAV